MKSTVHTRNRTRCGEKEELRLVHRYTHCLQHQHTLRVPPEKFLPSPIGAELVRE